MQQINLNHRAKVKITPAGIIHLQKRHQEIYGKYAPEHKFNSPEIDDEGYTTYQIWELFGTFGAAMQYPTHSPPIEPDIYLLDN